MLKNISGDSDTKNFNGIKYVSSLMHPNLKRSGFHAHSQMEIVYTVSGTGKTLLKNTNKEIILEPDTVTIYWPGVQHNQLMKTLGNDICIFCTIDFAENEWLPKDQQFLHVDINSAFIIKKHILALADTLPKRNRMAQQSANLRCVALLIDLLELAKSQQNVPGKAKNEGTHYNKHAAWAYNYICSNYKQIVSVKEVADEAGVSYDYLRHKFREIYQLSMKQHLLQTRLEWALLFLEHSPMSIAQIAEECGFENQRYFTTCVKQHCGLPPRKYRRTYLSQAI